jgi:hypothetical protein
MHLNGVVMNYKGTVYPSLTTARMMQKATNLIIYFPHSIMDKNVGYFFTYTSIISRFSTFLISKFVPHVFCAT